MAMMPDHENFIEQLRALASEASCQIIGVLAENKPNPVPVHVFSEKLGFKQSTTSMYLRRLRNTRLILLQGRHEGYVADTAQIRSLIGTESYTRITKNLQ